MNALLIHGLMGCKEDFSSLITHLNIPCHAIDLPQKTSFDSMLDAIYTIIKKKMRTPCIIIGYSMGGRLAMLFACKFPDLVSHLILLSANPGIDDPKLVEKRIQTDLKWAQILQIEGFDVFLQKWYDQPLFSSLKNQPKLYREVINRRISYPPTKLAKMLVHLSVAKHPSMWEFLPNLGPQLHMFGEKDRKYLPIFNRLRNWKKIITAKKIPESSHALHLENPKACAEKIHTFLTMENNCDTICK
ncbi:MAG: alpha/beta fold hydrolase [Simkaniaceae bacterium]|nr:alpha/beta fold hydrolase [Simkaniaceae bacterium]